MYMSEMYGAFCLYGRKAWKKAGNVITKQINAARKCIYLEAWQHIFLKLYVGLLKCLCIALCVCDIKCKNAHICVCGETDNMSLNYKVFRNY